MTALLMHRVLDDNATLTLSTRRDKIIVEVVDNDSQAIVYEEFTSEYLAAQRYNEYSTMLGKV